MIPVRKEHSLQQHGSSVASNKMTISATPEMFDLLSSGIYKNPIEAVVREYLANAVDESGVVDIVVPTSLAPYFKVRDYGKGMSTSFVLELFSSYGFSDKTKNNSQIGGFGIGSKSGFAYTDSFTVRSWVDGTVSTYECTKASDGTFNITLRGSRHTTEVDGTEIIIPVKSGDYSTFRSKIHYFTSYLKFFRGITFNGTDGHYTTFKHIKGDLYSGGPVSGLVVVMGGIPYTCNTNGIISNTHESLLEDSSFVVVQPIGSLAITASRESIRYNDDTVSKLKPIFEEAVKDLVKHHQEHLDTLTTAYEKYKYCVGLTRQVSNVLDVSQYNIDLTECVKCYTSRAGTVRDSGPSNIFSNLQYRYGLDCPENFIIIDTDKFVPSRIKRVWEDVSQYLTLIKPLNNLKATTDELSKVGIPYQLLSTFEPLKKARVKGGTTLSKVSSVTKDEALVVYYKGHYYDNKYTHEERLDLANASGVCYYDRNTEADYELDIYQYKVTDGYKVISATNKNLSKLQASSIPHIKTVIDEWVKKGECNSDRFIKSYLNKHWVMPTEVKYLVDEAYGKPVQFNGVPEWATLPDYIKDNFNTDLATNFKKELLDKIKFIETLTVKSYDGTVTVPISKWLDWPRFKTEVGL